jgi:DUF3014 family protein
MKKLILIVVIIFALAIAATYYPWQQTDESEPVTENSSVSESDDFLKITGSDEKPGIKYPVPKVPSESIEVESVDEEPAPVSVEIPITPEPVVIQTTKPLPQLDESDNDIAAAFRQLTDVAGLFSFKSFIRHFVVTIDNMTNQKIPQRYIFTQRVPETFAVIKQDVDTTVLDSKNFRRYSEFVNLAEQVNTRKLVVQYVRFYPLFQEAYEELGYPYRYFNDRFIQVIDHLLAAPEVKGTIHLVRPKVFYHFVKPELEALSAGQKILVRIGYDNAQRVKAKLRELRTVLTTLSPQ